MMNQRISPEVEEDGLHVWTLERTDGKPNLIRWFERVSSRESFARTNPFPPEQEVAE